MRKLGEDYRKNVAFMNERLRVEENFDVLSKTLRFADGEATLYYIDGFVKDTVMKKLMMHFLSQKKIPRTAREFMETAVPYVETDVTEDADLMVRMVLSGATLMLAETFGSAAVIIDSRTYPARETAEPEGDRVMIGARDGFVETLIFNTALVRRRIRNPALTMHYMSVGSDSGTDVVICYMADRADLKYVVKVVFIGNQPLNKLVGR